MRIQGNMSVPGLPDADHADMHAVALACNTCALSMFAGACGEYRTRSGSSKSMGVLVSSAVSSHMI